MKNKLYIIAFVVLLLTSGGIALFAKKQLDKKRAAKALEQGKESEEEVVEEPPSPKRELEKPTQDLNIESDISVEVNTENRSVAYNMHYNGIAVDGIFKEGDQDVVISKSFGSFSIKQAVPKATIISPINSNTKGGAIKGKTGTALIKIGAAVVDTETSKPVAILKSSDLVYLSINDEHGALNTLTINLLTGAKTGSKSPRNWDGD